VNTETIFSAISVDIKCSELDASFFLAISENDEVKITENAKKVSLTMPALIFNETKVYAIG